MNAYSGVNKKAIVIIYISLLVTLLLSGTVIRREFSVELMVVLDIAVLILVFIFRKGKFNIQNILLTILIGLFFLLQFFTTSTELMILIKTIHKIIILFLLGDIVVNYRINFIRAISQILFFLMTLSFIIYLMLIFNIDVPIFYVQEVNLNSAMFLNVKTLNVGFSTNLPRNYGIYWEPGMYQIFLNFILIYYLHIQKDYKKTIFIILNIITTFSITGYFVSLVIIMLDIIRKKMSLSKLAIIMVALGLFIVLLPTFFNIVKFKLNEASYNVRSNDFFYSIDLFKESPIWGHGIDDQEFKEIYFLKHGVRRGNTNGLTGVIYQMGLIGLFFHVTGLSLFVKYLESMQGQKLKLIFLAFFIASLSNEPIQLHEFTILLIAIGYNFYFNRKNQINYEKGKKNNG